MPAGDAERLHDLAASGAWVQAEFGPVPLKDQRIVERIKAAIGGKDLRALNSKHNTHKVKGRRMGYLDVSKKSA
jgi:hypothetical protein